MTQQRMANLEPIAERCAKLLGYLGGAFIPSLILLGWLVPDGKSLAIRVSVIYAGTILAFLGGIQWGFALQLRDSLIAIRRMAVGVLAPLWAVVALCLPIAPSVAMLLLGFATLVAYEWFEHLDATYPRWYLPLRLRLTALITAGLAATLLL